MTISVTLWLFVFLFVSSLVSPPPIILLSLLLSLIGLTPETSFLHLSFFLFLPAAKPTGHRTVHVLLLGGETISLCPCKLFSGVFWSQISTTSESVTPLLPCSSPLPLPFLNTPIFSDTLALQTVIPFPSFNNYLLLTNQTPQVNEQILFLFWETTSVAFRVFFSRRRSKLGHLCH